MSAAKIETFDRLQRWPSAYGKVLEECGGDSKLAEAKYCVGQFDSDTQIDWFLRREAIEKAMGVHRSAVYGALNIGNLGTVGAYGPFCVVLPATPDNVVGVLPFNSAECYVDETGMVNKKKLGAEASTWANRGATATLRHESELPNSIRDSWADLLVCATHPGNPSNFVEVVIDDQTLSLASCLIVRVDKLLQEQLDVFDQTEEADRALGFPTSLSPVELESLRAYRLLLQMQMLGSLIIESV